MQNKFTSGPWEYSNTMGGGKKILVSMKDLQDLYIMTGHKQSEKLSTWYCTDPQSVCIAGDRWVQFEPLGWDKMQDANGKLMAAAPELLGCLMEAVKILKGFGVDYIGAKSIIEKATK